ncbi:MAG: DPP IV N-terminal domain-containing protein, partial [Opitutales bacterium]
AVDFSRAAHLDAGMRLPLRVCFLLALAGGPAVSLSAAEDAALQYFRDLAETRNYTLGRPVSPRLTPDGATAVFLRAAPRNPTLRLYQCDVATGAERELLTPEQILGRGEEKLSAEEKARRERQRQSLKGFTDFRMSRDGTRLLVTLSGRLYLVDRATGKFRALPGSGWIDPRFSPDGRFVSAVQARELHLIDPATGTEHALTTGATATLSHGVAEFVAQEEMKRDEGYWWSPDSSTLLYQETDESAVEVRHIADPLHPEEPPIEFFYPKAGSPNARVRLGLLARDGAGPTRWIAWDNIKYPYLARVVWDKPRAPLTLLVQNREQTRQCLLAVDPVTGATRELLTESDAAWLNLDYETELPLWLEDGRSFLWTTEQRGAWQVELRDDTGRLVRELTPVTYSYRGLVNVDEAAGNILVRGSLDSREVQLWRFPLSGGPGEALTHERGQHGAIASRGTNRVVHTFDLFDGRYGVEVMSAEGRTLATLAGKAENPPALPTTELTQARSLPAFDAAVTRPRNFQPGRLYPVILSVYAGPTAKRVNALIRDYFPDQWMADQGYVVVRLDGRGTPWKGRDWERVIKGNLIDVPLHDQIAGLQALAGQYPEIDLTRVGVTGWSFGGYFSAMATIRRPDVFRAGVAGAPVITWENYDTHYTERYLSLPQTAPDAYRVSDVTTYARELRRPLLLIHGLTDDNVYFQHTLQLADALFLAGKPYELLPQLGTHMIADPLVKLRQQQRIIEFFNLNLKGTQ